MLPTYLVPTCSRCSGYSGGSVVRILPAPPAMFHAYACQYVPRSVGLHMRASMYQYGSVGLHMRASMYQYGSVGLHMRASMYLWSVGLHA